MNDLLSQIRSKSIRSALFILALAGFGATAIHAQEAVSDDKTAPTTLSGVSCEGTETAETEEVYFTSCGGFI